MSAKASIHCPRILHVLFFPLLHLKRACWHLTVRELRSGLCFRLRWPRAGCRGCSRRRPLERTGGRLWTQRGAPEVAARLSIAITWLVLLPSRAGLLAARISSLVQLSACMATDRYGVRKDLLQHSSGDSRYSHDSAEIAIAAGTPMARAVSGEWVLSSTNSTTPAWHRYSP